MIKIYNILAGVFCFFLLSCDKEYYTEYREDKLFDGMDITKYGAIGDGQTDCSGVINQLIAEFPATGGVIIIPEGDFVLDHPIIVNKNNVTIKGGNPGMRSNIDVKGINELLGPGGGSKLVLRKTKVGIQVPVSSTRKAVEGLEIKDLLISGGTENNGTGILIEQPSKESRIFNVIGINLNLGINVNKANGMLISDCWICEVKSSLEINNGSQNKITRCQLGAQPIGITCKLTQEDGLIFSNNHIYPDGTCNLMLIDCDQATISNNNFKSYYVGMLDVKGNENCVDGNIFWLAESNNQLLNGTKRVEDGVVSVAGNFNLFTSNTLTCEWVGVENPVTVNATIGENNKFSNCLIDNLDSDRVFLINARTDVGNCVSANKVEIID